MASASPVRDDRAALAGNPTDAQALIQLGADCAERGQTSRAIALFRRAFRCKPTDGAPALVLANLERARGNAQIAADWYHRAIALNPQSANALASYGTNRLESDLMAEAERYSRRALRLDPGSSLAAINLGMALKAQGRTDESLAAFQQAVALRPDYNRARFAACIAHLPMIAEGPDDVLRRRSDYRRALDALATRYAVATPQQRAAAADAVGSMQPFFLPYQGENDRALQATYGSLIANLMQERYPQFRTPLSMPEDEPDGRLRIGFVSAHFQHHSVWKITTYGWLDGLDRSRFRPYCYHLAYRDDAQTGIARRLVPDFRDGPHGFEDWARIIRADRLHALIYPEIGINATTARLATLRLAPVQAIGLGHPQTTGLDTIDYFLSSALMEPPGNESFYTERLVRFPNMGITYIPVPLPRRDLTRAELGIRDDAVLFACCQSLFKYLPRLDHVFPAIAARAPNVQLLFLRLEGETATDIFEQRLARAFDAAGLDYRRHCVIAPRLDAARFAGMLRCADLFLDSIGWSGFNSSIEALLQGLPVLTLPLQACRARHSAAVLTTLGMPDMIARDLDDYIDKAAALAGSPSLRAETAARVRTLAPRLCRDPEPLAAFERFLVEAIRQRAAAG